MATGNERVEIEHIKNIIVTSGFKMQGYSINPDSIIITLNKDCSECAERDIFIADQQIRRLLEAFGWSVTASQTINNIIVVTAEKKRFITSRA